MGEIGTRAGNGGNLGRKWVAGLGDLVGGHSVEDERRPETEDGQRWRSHGGWVLAGDGERRWQARAKIVAEAGRRPDMEDGRNWKNDGERTLAEDGERWWQGRAWSTVAGRAWWWTVGRRRREERGR
jgi:hypothetical protein